MDDLRDHIGSGHEQRMPPRDDDEVRHAIDAGVLDAARDPLTFVAVAALLGAISIAASFIPARRASRVDPLVALRAS